MKKSLKTTILAIAMLVTVTGVFATQYTAAPKSDDPVYRWTKTGQPGFYDGTVLDAQGEYQCFGGNVPCAQGELISGDGPLTEEIHETE